MMPIELVETVTPSPDYRQDVFRVSPQADDGWLASLVLHLPERQAEDRKVTSKKQRETLAHFFWETDLLPADFGWQQASRLMEMRGLAYAVSETMEEGFLAQNRMAIAPLIAAYISRSPYLRSVARGWSLGTWREASTRSQSDWLMLIASPFYRELLEFALLARDDLCDAMTNAS